MKILSMALKIDGGSYEDWHAYKKEAATQLLLFGGSEGAWYLGSCEFWGRDRVFATTQCAVTKQKLQELKEGLSAIPLDLQQNMILIIPYAYTILKAEKNS